MSSPYTSSLAYVRELFGSAFDPVLSSTGTSAASSSSITLPELSFFLSLLPPLTWLVGSSDHHQQQTLLDYGLGLGYESGTAAGLVPWICFGFRILAGCCVLPFVGLILLDLVGYLIARTLHIAPRRVRVRASSSSSSPRHRATTTLESDSPAVSATSSSLHSSTSPSILTNRKVPHFVFPSSSTITEKQPTSSEPRFDDLSSSISPVIGLQPLSSAGSSASSSSSNLTELGRVIAREEGGLGLSGSPVFATKRQSRVKNLHISPISPPDVPPRSRSTPPSAAYSTTPGERHMDLPFEPLPSSSDSFTGARVKRSSSTRARAASIGVEGALGLESDDDDEEVDGQRSKGDVDGDEMEGLGLRRVQTITPGSRY